jgi:membrane protein
MTANGPSEPTDLPKRSWWATLKRTFREFKEDNLTDWAAALTYYAVLSVFPALIALLSIVGLVADPATVTRVITETVSEIGPATAAETFSGPINDITENQSAAGLALVLGLAGALWTASGYVGAFMRASNAIYDVEEGRPIWKTAPTRFITTLVLLLMLAAVAIAVTFTGPLAEQAGNVLGVGSMAIDVWDIAKWPVILVVVMTMFAILYWAAPNVKHPKFRWVSPGGIVGVLLWILASAAFAFYVANFGSYNKTYGALGGVIVFLTWLWISNIAVLLGAEFNAELERGRQIEAGHPEEKEPFLEPRDTRKMKNA